MSVVSIVRTLGKKEEDIFFAVRQAIELSGGLDGIVNRGDKVLIKPNLVAVPKERLTGAITRWEVCKEVADMVMELGGEPIIAESSAAGVDTEMAISAGGYNRLRDMGYKVIDLKRAEKASIKVDNGMIIDVMESFEIVKNADAIISVPVMKTHDQTEITLGMKNLKGLICDNQKKEFHRIGVLNGVVDLVASLKPALTVIDGTVAQEGFGPVFGDPVEMGLVIASRDIVACDAVAGAVMGYDPEEVMITKLAHERNLGEMNLNMIEIKGSSIQDVRRRFKRSSEVEIPGLPKFDLIFTEGACTGCKNTVLSAIMDMKSDGIEYLLEGKFIIAGPIEELPQGVKKEDIILVGKCVMNMKDFGTFVPGCPPNNINVVKGIVGDRIKVERRYATESGVDS